MSFICDRCHVQQPKRSKPTRVTIETRPVRYEHRNGPTTYGIETVREEDLCVRCTSRTKSKFILPA